jgi:hypothetical protein
MIADRQRGTCSWCTLVLRTLSQTNSRSLDSNAACSSTQRGTSSSSISAQSRALHCSIALVPSASAACPAAAAALGCFLALLAAFLADFLEEVAVEALALEEGGAAAGASPCNVNTSAGAQLALQPCRHHPEDIDVLPHTNMPDLGV